jgi:hypothetical protein
MNKLKAGGAFPPTDIEGLRPYVDPKSPQALDDESLMVLKEVWNPTADGGGDSGGYEALQILAAQYKRNLNAPKKTEYSPMGVVGRCSSLSRLVCNAQQ